MFKGVLLLILVVSATAYVMLNLPGTSWLVGIAAIAAVLLVLSMTRFLGAGRSSGSGGGHKNSLTLLSELLGIAGFVIAILTLKK